MIYLLFAIAIISGLHTWFRLRYFLHIFQLEGYKRNEFHAWLGRRIPRVVFTNQHLLGGLVLGLTAIATLFAPVGAALIGGGFWFLIFLSSQRYSLYQQKKPLRYTPRMIRLAVLSVLIAFLPVIFGFLLYWDHFHPAVWGFYLFGWLLADVGVPAWVSAAALFLIPVESRIQNGFKRAARKRLSSRSDLIVVGITGSYGKTSVKFIVSEILGLKYNVLATPGSYNTPMGICLVVNTQLRADHQVLILEMGARYTGDIKELCQISAPDVAVVTSVGVAHLDTMGPIENIARVKREIIENMKPDGIAILNADDPRVDGMRPYAPGKVWRVSLSDGPADIHAWDIQYGPEGTSFLVQDELGNRHRFDSKLLGAHNVQNLLLGIAIGRAFGLRLRQIAHAVRRIEPIPHRLQLRDEGYITVIDDAFNSNPVGAKNAVEILAQFDSGRRIIVTPGMVELGEKQEFENRELGKHIAEKDLDRVILVGKRQTEPIQMGLLEAGFPEDRLILVDSFFEAQSFLKTYLLPGDVVLYENDLPDQYNEVKS